MTTEEFLKYISDKIDRDLLSESVITFCVVSGNNVFVEIYNQDGLITADFNHGLFYHKFSELITGDAMDILLEPSRSHKKGVRFVKSDSGYSITIDRIWFKNEKHTFTFNEKIEKLVIKDLFVRAPFSHLYTDGAVVSIDNLDIQQNGVFNIGKNIYVKQFVSSLANSVEIVSNGCSCVYPMFLNTEKNGLLIVRGFKGIVNTNNIGNSVNYLECDVEIVGNNLQTVDCYNFCRIKLTLNSPEGNSPLKKLKILEFHGENNTLVGNGAMEILGCILKKNTFKGFQYLKLIPIVLTNRPADMIHVIFEDIEVLDLSSQYLLDYCEFKNVSEIRNANIYKCFWDGDVDFLNTSICLEGGDAYRYPMNGAFEQSVIGKITNKLKKLKNLSDFLRTPLSNVTVRETIDGR